MKDVFIIGSKGIPARYGGFETFVENLTKGQQDKDIHYHVACMGDRCENVTYNGAECFYLKVPSIGPAKAIWYDVAAFRWCLAYIREHQIKDAVVYVLACRIGPFVGQLAKQLHRLGGRLYVNPDGHEWLRAKWSRPIRWYWKLSEKRMVKYADLLICDSKNIERYIQTEYSSFRPATTFLAYGTNRLQLTDDKHIYMQWLIQQGLAAGEYYLIVGRFVPENNYETMIREFLASDTKRKLAIITNVEENKFYNRLKERTHFTEDTRICFTGTVYDENLLGLIRQNAYGYLHGHEVGGTNPSLLEALSTTRLNLLLDVGFNHEVGEDAALYWTKDAGSLANLIAQADALSEEECSAYGRRAADRMEQYYSWAGIIAQYERLFKE